MFHLRSEIDSEISAQTRPIRPTPQASARVIRRVCSLLCLVFSEDRQLKGSRDTKTETPSHVAAPGSAPARSRSYPGLLTHTNQYNSLLCLGYFGWIFITCQEDCPEWSNHHISHVKTLKPRQGTSIAQSHQNPTWEPALGPHSPHKWRFMHFLISPCPFLFVKTDYDFCVWMRILGGKETVERSFLELS